MTGLGGMADLMRKRLLPPEPAKCTCALNLANNGCPTHGARR